MTTSYDAVVVGAGVVGCAVARDLAASGSSVALLDARGDVGDGTSKANTAILPTGFDKPPGSIETAMVVRGGALLREYARVAGIAIEQPGGLLVAWNDEQAETLPQLQAKAIANDYHATELIEPAEAYARVPSLGERVLGALFVPGESIIDPWSTTLAFASDAVARGVELRLDCRVEAVAPGGDVTTLSTSHGEITARWVINAAGLGSDVMDRFFGYDRFRIIPRRGELIVFDKLARPMAPHIVLPVPSPRGKGVLISPTVFGNVMLGPTAEDLDDKGDTSTSAAGLKTLFDKARTIMPALLEEEVVATYAGLRAATEHTDYVIDVDADQRYVCLGGIRSTGLVSSLAIAEHVVAQLASEGFAPDPERVLPETHAVPSLGEGQERPYQRASLIDMDGAYGDIVCFCERVTRGEIRDALDSPIPPRDLDGLRRRTRALMGRCGGFFCGAEVESLLDEGATR